MRRGPGDLRIRFGFALPIAVICQLFGVHGTDDRLLLARQNVLRSPRRWRGSSHVAETAAAGTLRRDTKAIALRESGWRS